MNIQVLPRRRRAHGLAAIHALCLLLLIIATPAAAQAGGRVWISSPVTSQFPVVSFKMETYDDQGNFITDLQPGEVEVVEDGKVRPLGELTLEQPGLQIIVALNEGPVMQNHYAGVSAFDRIKDRLQQWSVEQPFQTPDQFSLLTNAGFQSTYLTVPAEWAKALAAYRPDLMKQPVALNSLFQALDMATDAQPDSGIKRVIFYITQPLTSEVMETFPSLIERAAQQDVHIFVWMVSTAPDANPNSTQLLSELAARTQGGFFQFTGPEALPDPEDYLQPLRYRYQCSYFSSVAQAGAHSLVVRLKGRGLNALSEARQFQVNILPPQPVFLAPPPSVNLSWSETGEEGSLELEPRSIPIGAVIEFPDGYERALEFSRLYVDGVIAAEITEPPFTQFEWVVGDYGKTATHSLKIEVVDVLGLKGTTIDIPIEVIVEPKPGDGFFTPGSILVIIAVISTALVLAAVLFLAGRRTLLLSGRLQQARQYRDPLTQPVRVRHETALKRDIHDTMEVRPLAKAIAPARLVSVAKSGNAINRQSIDLHSSDITIGSDPAQAICVLESASISGLHARIYRTMEGEYMIADFGSASGTWVNYAPVSTQGMRLENGDLVHIGKAAFRFELRRSALTNESRDSHREGE